MKKNGNLIKTLITPHVHGKDKGSKLSSKIIFIVLVFLVGQHDTIAHHVRVSTLSILFSFYFKIIIYYSQIFLIYFPFFPIYSNFIIKNYNSLKTS